MKNIFYFRAISKIGGTEQFLYEIAKKYKDWDITVFYDVADKYQLKRLKKFVRCKQRIKGEKVVCDKAFFNFNTDMIDDVEAKEYYFVSHANYEELNRVHGGYIPPIDNKKINHYIGVSQFATDKLDEYAKRIGSKIKTQKCYNPLTLEEVKKPKIIVSACRLDDKVKGGVRTLNLIEALDKYCKENPDEHYLWLIFTNPNVKVKITSPNVVIMKPRVDVRPYIASADYVAQLSNDMETYCYTINEALGYGVPVITTPLSVIKELPIDDNMRIELEYDCSNVDEVARQIFEKKVNRFEYQIPEDDWADILEKGKSTYKEELKMIKCEAIEDFTLNDFDELKNIVRSGKNVEGKLFKGDTFECDEEMANYLSGGNIKKKVVVKVVEVLPKEKQVEATIEYHEEEKEPKAVVKTTKKKKSSKK